MKTFHSIIVAAVLLLAIGARADEAADSIIHSPVGLQVNYDQTVYFSSYYGDFWESGYYQRVRFGADGTVYFHNGLMPALCGDDVWVRGTIDGNIIRVPSHQLIGISMTGTKFYMGGFAKDQNGNWWECDNFNFTISADSSQIQLLDYDTIWLFGYDENYIVYARDTHHSFRRFDWTEVTPPANARQEAYTVTYYGQGSSTPAGGDIHRVVFDGDDVYLRGMALRMGSSWLKGRRNGNTITLPAQTYLGNSGNYIEFAFAAKDIDGVITPCDSLTLTISDDMKEIRGMADEYLLTGYSASHPEATIGRFELSWFDLHPLVPAMPVIDRFTNGEFCFTVPVEGADGERIDGDLLSWRLYVNGELYTFTPQLYPSLAEPTTEIGHTYVDFVDFLGLSGVRRVVIKADDVQTLGVESVYTVDGIATPSGVATLVVDDKTQGIADAAADSPASITYTDLQGRSYRQHPSGLSVRTIRLADGTTRSEKVFGK